MTPVYPALENISLDPWQHSSFRRYGLEADVLRLDKIHPEISGNKWFKLKYYLEKAGQTKKKTVISYGGPYSNHLLAVAAASQLYGFGSVGLVRGEKPKQLSNTLRSAEGFGMKLSFLPRQIYDLQKKTTDVSFLTFTEADSLVIPEGGNGPEGMRGAAEILSIPDALPYTHICCAVGTATTMAGIINGAPRHIRKMGISVLKGTHDLEPLHIHRVEESGLKNTEMIHDYHGGGYARYTPELLSFMNRLFLESGIPTDIVYTGKLFHAIVKMTEINKFEAGSRLLILHTGGLPGNCSLTPGLLQF
jgi:1-aminocyclopropane-1-carboxylate deaminase